MKNPRVLFVAGNFDRQKGRASGVAAKIRKSLSFKNVDFYNGGSFDNLLTIIDTVRKYEVIIWLANVSNQEPKLVEEIKKLNPKAILITSKRNLEKAYELKSLLNRALKIKSNLVIEFIQKDKLYCVSLLDPLGNIFVKETADLELLGKVLEERICELLNFTRMRSVSLGPKLPAKIDPRFLELVTRFAGTFHCLIHPEEGVERFLGNASFRCERGFPSFKQDGLIFVTKRNVDKRSLSAEDFVAIKQSKNQLGYFGTDKPSVDSPIQLALYEYFPNVKFMVHSHVYLEGAAFSHKIIPCGALEEITEITSRFPKEAKNFSLNLAGHGSIALASDLNYFENLHFIPRSLPEIVKRK